MRLLILSTLLLLVLSTRSQTNTSNQKDTSKYCLPYADYKIILAGAYEGECTKYELNACQIDLKNEIVKKKRRNTAIIVLVAIEAARIAVGLIK